MLWIVREHLIFFFSNSIKTHNIVVEWYKLSQFQKHQHDSILIPYQVPGGCQHEPTSVLSYIQYIYSNVSLKFFLLFCHLKLLLWIHTMWLIVKYTFSCDATNLKVKEDVSMDFEDPAISRNERKHSAITSSKICMYIFKNRYKK